MWGQCVPHWDRCLKIPEKIVEILKIEKMFEMNGLPSLFCRVRYAHTIKQTPRQKMANAIIWLCPPTTQSKCLNLKNIEQ
jgi:hypothetical protein